MSEIKLIFDCGSTKCTIVEIHNGKYQLHHTVAGFNPILHPTIREAVAAHFQEYRHLFSSVLSEIQYCGAGCINKSINDQVKQGLTEVFGAESIEISNDLTFIPKALGISEPCMIGILGTGSNAGRWNGSEIDSNTISGGYLIGDEGSAYSLGRRLIANYLRGHFSDSTARSISNELYLEEKDVIKEIYESEQPNQRIASFARIFGVIEDPLLDQIMAKCLQEFIDERIIPIRKDIDVIHLFGSVAYFNLPYLKLKLEELNLRVGIVAKEPLDIIIGR